MASVAKRPNGKWRARYRDDAGKEHARHFDRKLDAQRWLDDETAGLVRGDWIDRGTARSLSTNGSPTGLVAKSGQTARSRPHSRRRHR